MPRAGLLALGFALGIGLADSPAAQAAPVSPRRNPAAAQLAFARARLAAAQGRPQDAVRLCTVALAADPALPGARHLRAVSLVRLGRWAPAERDLQRLVAARPRDRALHRLLGLALLRQRKWMWAARQYQRLLQLEPRSGAHWLAFGYCLLRVGEPEEARKALARAQRYGPAPVASQARVLQAVGLYRAGKLRQARRRLQGLRGAARPEAERLTRLIYGAEGRAEQGLTLRFRLGTGYDSNVSQDPADARGSGSAGWMQRLGAAASWRAFTWGRHAVGVSGALSRTFALNWWEPDSCVPDYSTLVGSVSPWWAVRFATGGVDHELRVAYRGQVITLDGDCSGDTGFHAFSESHTGAAQWALRESDRTATHLVLEVGYTLFRQQVRDQLGAALEVGQSIFLARRRVKLYPALSLRYEHARAAWWTAVAARAGLSASALLPGRLDLVASLSAELRVHPDSAQYRPWLAPGNRRDVILRAQGSLGRAFTTWLRGDVYYRYRLNHSTAQVWDYQRHEVGLALTAQVALLKPKKAPRGAP